MMFENTFKNIKFINDQKLKDIYFTDYLKAFYNRLNYKKKYL